VSKPGFEIDVSQLEQILAQTLQENLSHIARHCKFLFPNSKANASVLHVCCIIAAGVMGRDASRPFDHSSEIEFGVLLSQLCVTFCDILSKGGPFSTGTTTDSNFVK